jgi:nucleoside-diphosphate-sugar epimerase
MNVLITGATGFVGRALVNHLLANDVNVLAGMRKPSANLPDSVHRMVIGDLSMLKEMSAPFKYSLFDGVDVVIHSAARVHVMNDDLAHQQRTPS